MNDLIDKLKSLGLIIPSSKIKSGIKTQSLVLEDIYEGNWIPNNLGNVYLMNKTIPYGSEFGLIYFENDFSPESILNLSENNIGKKGKVSLDKVVFLDIETTNLSIGAGSFAFLIGLCHFSEKGLHTNLLFIKDPNDEIGLLTYLDYELSKFDIIASYNGKSFDIPLLRNRFVMQQLNSKSLNKLHVDLLHISRKIWKARLHNCRLSDIEREILKFTRSNDEIPGWLIPQIYFDYLDQKNPSLLQGIFYHNRIDVLSLAALFQYINSIINRNEYIDTTEGIDLTSIGRIFQKLGQKDLSVTFYKLGVEKGINENNAATVHRNFGYLYKKHHDWEEAVFHWNLAADRSDIESCVELAKYYEHIERSYSPALTWTRKAEELFNQRNSEYFPNIKLKQKLIHRRKRLLRKMKTIE